MVSGIFGDKERLEGKFWADIFLGLNRESWVWEVYVVAAIIYASKCIYMYILYMHMYVCELPSSSLWGF